MASTGFSQKTLLIVEDDRSSLEALVALARTAGYKAFGVGNAKQAVNYLYNSTLPNLILLDLRLPDKGGEEFAWELQANPLFKKIPIIVISGHIDPSTTIQGVKTSFEKPIINDQLLDAISNYSN